MRILFVVENYYPHIGGVEVVFKSLADGLAKRGHRVDVITHKLKGTKSREIINGVNIHRISCFRSRYWFTFLSIPKAVKLAKNADIIHTTTYNGAFPAWIASKISGKPSIITIHEILGKNWRKFGMGRISSFFHKAMEKIIVSLKFNRFVGVSDSTKRQIIDAGVQGKKVLRIYNGVDYDFWNPKRYNGKKIREKMNLDGKFVYLFFGRPGISKGLEYLIKAIPQISKEIPNSLLLAIVSRDRQYKKRYNMILGLVKKLGISSHVKIIDPMPRKMLPNYVMAADCIVVPSLSEGFGFTAAESCAMGKPVVATNAGSLPEVVSGRYVLVKPKSPREIAKGVKIVYQKKGVKGKAKKFKIEGNISNYLKIYKKLLK